MDTQRKSPRMPGSRRDIVDPPRARATMWGEVCGRHDAGGKDGIGCRCVIASMLATCGGPTEDDFYLPGNV